MTTFLSSEIFFALSFLSDTQETVFVFGRWWEDEDGRLGWFEEEEAEEAKEALGALLTMLDGAFGGDTLNLERFAVDPAEGIGKEAACEGM